MREVKVATAPVGRSNRRQRSVIVFLILLSLLLFFHRLGSLSLFDADEPAFAEATREMLLSGDWITPHFNFEPRFDKPILFYWLMALAYKSFGIGEFAARFWSAAFATGLVLSIYLFGRQVLGQRGALIAALAFTTNIGTAILARAAVTDMTLVFFMTWTLFSFFAAYRATGPTPLGYLFVAYLTMALSVLTKGPIGLLLPLLVIGLFLGVRRTSRAALLRLRPFAGLALFAVIALPWYLLALRENGWAFVQGFFVKHHLVRYTGVISGHRGPIYYFLPVVLLGFFPWSGMLPKAFGELWRARARLRRDLTPREELLLFAWLWFGVVFVFFSLSGTKLPSYIFPAFPALALLAGAAGETLLDGEARAGKGGTSFDWLVGGIGGSLAGALVLLPIIVGSIRLRKAPDVPPFNLGLTPYLLAILFVLGPVIAVWARRRGRGNMALAALATTMVLCLLVAVHRVATVIQEGLQSPLREFADLARRELGPADLLVAYDLNAPSLVFYARRQVVTVRGGQEVKFQELGASARRLFVITKAAVETRLREVPDIFPLDRRGGYVLYSSRPSE
ncbi:MAG: glycosyltransferase family 39 protein [candidate division NC10 bacterium]|nr:glycosyltransferase family 39 protein [candidate division NC10 bacterium]